LQSIISKRTLHDLHIIAVTVENLVSIPILGGDAFDEIVLFQEFEKLLDQRLGVAAAADEVEHLLDRFVLFFEQFGDESDLGQYLARADEGVDLLQQRDGDDELFVGGDESLQSTESIVVR